jgi:L-amino acid N-acyltransferase YncA
MVVRLMGRSLLIRHAVSADAVAVAVIHVAAWRAAYRGFLPHDYLAKLSVDARIAYWTETIGTGDIGIVVAEIDGAVLGWAAFGIDCEVAELQAIYVDPAHWYRGIGKALCRCMFRSITARGCRQVTVWAFAGNAPALQFYASLNFRHNGEKLVNRGGIDLITVQLKCAAPYDVD